MTVLPWWRQRKDRRRAVNARLAALDRELGSRLDNMDRLRAEVLRLRQGAAIIRDTAQGGSFAKGAVYGFDRVIELLDGDDDD